MPSSSVVHRVFCRVQKWGDLEQTLYMDTKALQVRKNKQNACCENGETVV